ncbi:hydrogen gas-evolving membrane-bound hydrogenase subunit E [Thiocystis violascens]|uniref:Multisubunit Na+/H+ antiporter, MnhB subunit n=1 Tax=Thiocystis violascens (strain ATCC 17096 / DSM 198 / 6111) TaxID=765911 RepID=I3Y7W4_THIV6|nr:hydrogen gas-evolving membrane-bound hydrogenase subunit E [Thiocystis violascens]AFL73082.1 multisubunit Na+/H+ antiporter, MnhB subunit [Thiocystis violascens DSM 198]
MSHVPLRKRFRVQTLLLILLCGWLLMLHLTILLNHGLDGLTTGVGDTLLARNSETASANAVTSVVVSYRGFDTLGEVTVLFLAATGVGLLFTGGLTSSPVPRDRNSHPNEVMVTGTRLIFPPLLMLGVYVVLHGHLSPGGGFQGGVIVATAFFLRMIADPEFTLDHARLGWFESFAGGGFVLFGMLGLVILSTATFLGNFLPHPVEAMGQLVSAGVIPLVYLLVGIKVGAEVGAIFQDMLEPDHAPDHAFAAKEL